MFSAVFVLSARSVHAFSGSGAGTSGDPYQITTCSQLQEMNNSLSSYYKQMNDIDCTGVTFTSIGNGSSPFSGTFDGQNYAISNLSVTDSSYAGLFGLTDTATVQNTRITSGTITTTSGYAGGIIARAGADTTLSHSSSQVSLSGGGSMGGLVGYSYSGGLTIQNSFFNGTLTSTGGYTGGVIGNIYTGTNTITNTYSAGTLTQTSSAYFGGIAGAMNDSTTISNSYTSVTLVTTGTTYSGGLVGGFFNGTVTNSFSSATITGSGNFKGAVFGRGEGTASGLYADVYLAGTSTCSASGSASCTAKNSGNSEANYFKGNSTSAPMSSWNFTDTWQTNSGGYPTLRGFTSPSSSSGSSSSGSSCSGSAPFNAPDLFQMSVTGTSANLFFAPVAGANSSYVISYGFTPEANNFATKFDYGSSSGVIPYSINSLFPGTWYFKVRGQNGCVPGTWSSPMSVKIL